MSDPKLRSPAVLLQPSPNRSNGTPSLNRAENGIRTFNQPTNGSRGHSLYDPHSGQSQSRHISLEDAWNQAISFFQDSESSIKRAQVSHHPRSYINFTHTYRKNY